QLYADAAPGQHATRVGEPRWFGLHAGGARPRRSLFVFRGKGGSCSLQMAGSPPAPGFGLVSSSSVYTDVVQPLTLENRNGQSSRHINLVIGGRRRAAVPGP